MKPRISIACSFRCPEGAAVAGAAALALLLAAPTTAGACEGGDDEADTVTTFDPAVIGDAAGYPETKISSPRTKEMPAENAVVRIPE